MVINSSNLLGLNLNKNYNVIIHQIIFYYALISAHNYELYIHNFQKDDRNHPLSIY